MSRPTNSDFGGAQTLSSLVLQRTSAFAELDARKLTHDSRGGRFGCCRLGRLLALLLRLVLARFAGGAGGRLVGRVLLDRCAGGGLDAVELWNDDYSGAEAKGTDLDDGRVRDALRGRLHFTRRRDLRTSGE